MPAHTRLRTPPSPLPCRWTPNASSNSLSVNRLLCFWVSSVESISRISLHSNGFRSFCHVRESQPTAYMDEAEEERTDFGKLKPKIEALGIDSDSCAPGQYDLLYCPKCKGGPSLNRSLSFHISPNWSYAIWRCFDLQCGWAGQVFADTNMDNPGNLRGKINSYRPLTVGSLRLEMLGDELLTFFSERMISKETLQRNNVMQVAGNQKVFAFTYRQNGMLVGCKYRTVEKKFWQRKNTEKMLYGLDDIAEAEEIIIVEGEMDKLSMEEAGYYNCVSVPSGAPQMVSLKELPSPEKDSCFQYLWNCKDYFDKASRIILATDGDIPGQALAEELARRLGRERCWRVRWPKKNEDSSFKDANEVLMNLGADALRDAINDAELFETQN
ncbi:DNA helicase [Handroanthus impetiginosus]|uniref:DNA helicase n=1 Tax=Handroanthus impetiginosus TaxID=429701 RepID=A0A2G9FZJ2_9LAMI|nr:DNA helicase [Handroanthus impetiginosus]